MDATSDHWQSLYPFRSHFQKLDGHRLHYVDEGDGDVVLLVHGNPTWSFYYRNLISALRDRHRMVAVDHIGCGWSDKPQEYPYSLATHTSNLVQFIDQLDLQNITLVGHDWGGAIGLNAAVQRPQRFGRLVLTNTGAFPPPRVPWRIAACRTPVIGRFAVRGLNLFLRAAFRMATENPHWLTTDVRQGMLAPYGNWHDRVALYEFVRDIPLTQRHPTFTELTRLRDGLSQFRSHPIALIWGMRDWCFTPRCLDEFTRIWPQAEVHRLPAAGHWVVEDASDEVIELVGQFVARPSTVS